MMKKKTALLVVDIFWQVGGDSDVAPAGVEGAGLVKDALIL